MTTKTTLTCGEGETDPLSVRNRKGNIAWGDEPYDQAWSVGFVSVGDPMAKLLSNETNQQRRQELRDLRRLLQWPTSRSR